MKIIFKLVLLCTFATCLLGVQRQTFIAQNHPPVATGPTYQYIAAESGSCTANTRGCSITLDTVNGDLLVTNCAVSGTSNPQCTGGWRDANGENWNDEFQYSSLGLGASIGNTVIQSGSAGDVISCGGTLHTTSIACIITAYRSSTGWSGGGGGDPTDQGNYVSTNSGPCTVTAAGTTGQANELVVGGCVTDAGTPTSASGYSAANSGSFSSPFGSFWNGYQGVTSVGTYTFTTNGSLTTPLSSIMTLEPN